MRPGWHLLKNAPAGFKDTDSYHRSSRTEGRPLPNFPPRFWRKEIVAVPVFPELLRFLITHQADKSLVLDYSLDAHHLIKKVGPSPLNA